MFAINESKHKAGAPQRLHGDCILLLKNKFSHNNLFLVWRERSMNCYYACEKTQVQIPVPQNPEHLRK